MYFFSYNCFSGARESAAESAAKLTPVLFCLFDGVNQGFSTFF